MDEGIAGLAKEIAEFNMTAGEKSLFEHSQGATEDQIKLLKAYGEEKDRLEDRKKMIEDANQLTMQSIGPLEKYQNELDKINALRAEGLITQQTFDAATEKANDDLRKTFKDDNSSKKVGAETRRFDFTLAKEPQKQDPIQKLVEEGKKQTKAAEDSRFYLGEIYRFQNQADQQTPTFFDL